jgi:hypothetical protein
MRLFSTESITGDGEISARRQTPLTTFADGQELTTSFAVFMARTDLLQDRMRTPAGPASLTRWRDRAENPLRDSAVRRLRDV